MTNSSGNMKKKESNQTENFKNKPNEITKMKECKPATGVFPPKGEWPKEAPLPKGHGLTKDEIRQLGIKEDFKFNFCS